MHWACVSRLLRIGSVRASSGVHSDPSCFLSYPDSNDQQQTGQEKSGRRNESGEKLP